MMTLALAALLAVQDPAVYRDPALRIELPRPFADWQFAPATERGTTTILFYPRDGRLSDHLWGALIITSWDRSPRLDELAERRIAETYGRSARGNFTLQGVDTVMVDGLAAVRLRVAGTIDRAVLEIEEYLIARERDLVLLQLRYPRGVPRDSVAAGYARTIAGLRLSGGGNPPELAPSPHAPVIDRGLVVFQVPAGMRAVTAGALIADVTFGDQRTMRFRPPVPDDAPHYAVGRFVSDDRPVGRLTLRVWRNTERGVRVTPASDSMLAVLARGWQRYWNAFGPVPIAELVVVETDWPLTRGGAGIVFIGADAGDQVLLRELARTWWGSFARDEGPFAALINEGLPLWSPLVAGVPVDQDRWSGGLEIARRRVGDAAFREAIRTLAAEARSNDAAIPAFFTALGPAGSEIRNSFFR